MKRLLFIAMGLGIIVFWAIILLRALSNRNLFAQPGLFDMAAHWSPFIYQSTINNYDLITNFDFDGNWNGKDNWENAGLTQYYENFHAYVYYSIIESENHYFITYMFFHPRDESSHLKSNRRMIYLVI